MGRRLPWKKSATAEDAVKPESPKASASPRIQATPTRARLARASERNDRDGRIRSPSTSPPPEPPREEFMIPGPLNDDKYRMVEDELLGVAQNFTAHLHRAEYHRLKSVAKTQNAAAIRAIERPVVGTPSRITKQRGEALKRVSKQRAVLGNGHGRDLPWMGTSLQGLMEAPRKEARVIRSLPQAAAGTRAAAGFASTSASLPAQRSRPDESSAKERQRGPARDDTRPVPRSTPQRTVEVRSRPPTSIGSSSSKIAALGPSSTPSRPTWSTSRPSYSTPKPASTEEVGNEESENDDDDDDDDDDIFGIQKRRMRREKSRENIRKSAEKPARNPSPDNIPSFL